MYYGTIANPVCMITEHFQHVSAACRSIHEYSIISDHYHYYLAAYMHMIHSEAVAALS